MAAARGFDRDPYLSGIHRPVADESDFPDLAVEGEIPRALRGLYLRNGGNPRFEPLGRYHLFDGDGMLHAVSLADGRASYRNRWVRTAGLAAEERAGRALFGGMANPLQVDPQVAAEVGPIKNTANTHVLRHAGRILCLWEAGLPTEVTPALETVGLFDFGGRLAGPVTAHPRPDPATGELLFFGCSAFPPFLRYHVADADGKLARSVDLELPAPVMMHDFVTTAEHAIFLDAPAVFQLEQALRGGPLLAWKPENGARFGVLPRGGGSGDVVWLETDPCYVFHFLNAWSDGPRLQVDGCRIERMDIGLESEGETTPADAILTRWTLDLERGTCRAERLAELPGDFPRVAEAVTGRRNRYGYVASFSSGTADGGLFDCVVKYDFERGGTRIHHYGEGCVTGEAVFAPDPGGSAEDDGWLLSFVYDLRDDSSELVIVDARAPEDAPVARVRIPRRVPFGFHGSWLPEQGAAR